MQEIIKYKDIPTAIGTVDRNAPVSVLLSERQAVLFREYLEKMCIIPDEGGVKGWVESIGFALFQIRILFTHPNLIGLGRFYAIDSNTLKRIKFEHRSDNQVLIKFLPKSA